MKLYLSGPITGVKRYRSKFAKFEKQLREMGHTVINPAVETEGLNPADYLLISIARLNAADAIFLIPGWSNSKGAIIEALYAEYAGKEIYTESDNPRASGFRKIRLLRNDDVFHDYIDGWQVMEELESDD